MTKRTSDRFPRIGQFDSQMLRWAKQFDHFMYVNGNQHQKPYGSFPEMLFIGHKESLRSNENSFKKLQDILKNKDWLFGYFSYDLKNEIEALESNNPATIDMDHMSFTLPETIIRIEEEIVVIESIHNPKEIYQQIISTDFNKNPEKPLISYPKSRTTKNQYLHHVNDIKKRIVEGDFYEMNYCIEYVTQSSSFHPVHCYERLNTLSPMPFSVLMKINSKYLICASPERFLKKEKTKIISQPIKGTTKRSFDKTEDDALKNQLLTSEKERAENLMIVDLVRNDLSRTAHTGSVKVEELFGIYTFKKVHQMISTVTSEYNPENNITDIIECAFPMGSMTGAPKIRVMEEIEKLEDSARGLYSGAVGFFTPEGDFDFNVVIRSIIFDAESGKISFHVGSAITYDSIAEHEYNECLLKAESLFEVLAQ